MLAVVIAATLGALIPREYVFIALLGVIPILLIGGVAAWRQLFTPSDERRQEVLQKARNQSWPQFYKDASDAWRILGVHATEGDTAGVDWRIAHEGVYTLVHARRWKASVHGLEPFRQLARAMEQQGIGRGLYMAVGGEVSPPALRFAREHNIQIWQGDELALFLMGKIPLARISESGG